MCWYQLALCSAWSVAYVVSCLTCIGRLRRCTTQLIVHQKCFFFENPPRPYQRRKLHRRCLQTRSLSVSRLEPRIGWIPSSEGLEDINIYMSHLFGAKMNPHLQAASFSRAVHDSFFKGNARLFFSLFLSLLSPSNFHGVLGIGGLEPP